MVEVRCATWRWNSDGEHQFVDAFGNELRNRLQEVVLCRPAAVLLYSLSLDLTPVSGINFANLQHLELLRMDWARNAETLFECTNLKELAISKYPGKQSSVPFANLPHLQRLWLSCCGLEEIENFKAMTKLESLDLLNMSPLRSLHGMEELINLKKLRIESCKNIGDIEPIRNLQNLRRR